MLRYAACRRIPRTTNGARIAANVGNRGGTHRRDDLGERVGARDGASGAREDKGRGIRSVMLLVRSAEGQRRTRSAEGERRTRSAEGECRTRSADGERGTTGGVRAR
ncbi:hypothetical protein GCM10027360_18630 [Amycolatopsis echigonensis]